MKIILAFLFLSTFICSQNVEIRDELKKYFDEYNLDGCFVLYNLNNDSYIKYNPDRCSERFIPASTFKIFNNQNHKYTLRAKTGWGIRFNDNVGWFVGYVETKDNIYFFCNEPRDKKS